MSALVDALIDAAPFSWIGAGMGVALASWLLAWLLRARLAKPRRWLAFPILFSLALLTATAAAIACVKLGRRDVAGQLGAREAPVELGSVIVGQGIARQLTGLLLLGPIALVSLGSAGLLRWVSRKRPAVPASRSAVTLGMTLVLPLIIGALGASIYGLRVYADFYARWEPFSTVIRFQQAYHLLTLLRASIVASAVAGLIAAIVWARSAGARPLGPARVAIASVLFAAGLGAFVSTRGQAADRTPLPSLTYNQNDNFGIVYSEEMPRFSRCQPPLAEAPVLEFSPDHVRMFGQWVMSPHEVPDKLVEDRNRLQSLHPEKPLPPPSLQVVADVATPLASVIPYLERVGDIEIVMVGSTPRPFASRTLGILERREFCYRAFSLRKDGVPLSRHRTWRDLALAVDRSAAVLRIAAQ